MTTISRTLIQLLEDKGYGVFGQNIFLYRVPSSLKIDTDAMWVVPSGGTPIIRTKTGEQVKAYQFLIYLRSNSAQKVDEGLSVLEEELNCAGCVKLDGYELIDLHTTQFPASQDLDAENRMVGFLQVQLSLYKSCGN